MSSLQGQSETQAVLVSILLVDDHEPIRRTVRRLLIEHERWCVTGEARDGREAVSQAQHLKPDIVILDIHMPVMNGFEAAKEILRLFPEMLVLILSNDDSPQFAQAARVSGAAGLLAKIHADTELVNALAALLRGEKYFHSHID